MENLRKWATSCSTGSPEATRQTTSALAVFGVVPNSVAAWCTGASDAEVSKLVAACAADGVSREYLRGVCDVLEAPQVHDWVVAGQQQGESEPSPKRRRLIADDTDDEAEESDEDTVVIETTPMKEGGFYSVALKGSRSGSGIFRCDADGITWCYSYSDLKEVLDESDWPEKPPGRALYISTHKQAKIGADTPVQSVCVQLPNSRTGPITGAYYLAGIYLLDGPVHIVPFVSREGMPIGANIRQQLSDYTDFLCARGGNASKKIREAISAPGATWNVLEDDPRNHRRMRCSACDCTRRISTVVDLGGGVVHCYGSECSKRVYLAWKICQRSDDDGLTDLEFVNSIRRRIATLV